MLYLLAAQIPFSYLCFSFIFVCILDARFVSPMWLADLPHCLQFCFPISIEVKLYVHHIRLQNKRTTRSNHQCGVYEALHGLTHHFLWPNKPIDCVILMRNMYQQQNNNYDYSRASKRMQYGNMNKLL